MSCIREGECEQASQDAKLRRGHPINSGNPIKCLGKWFNEHRQWKHRRHREEVPNMAENSWWSGLLGKYKAWIYQRGILPRLMLMLLLHEVATTTVEVMKRKMSGFLRRWLWVQPSFTSTGLYSNSIMHTSFLGGGRIRMPAGDDIKKLGRGQDC